jgi:hypothetical protein
MESKEWIAVAALAVSCLSLYFSLLREWQSRHLSIVQRRNDLLKQLRQGIRAVERAKARVLEFDSMPRVRALREDLATLESKFTNADDKKQLESFRSRHLEIAKDIEKVIAQYDEMISKLKSSHSTVRDGSGPFASHQERVHVERVLNLVAEFEEMVDDALAKWLKSMGESGNE